MPEETVPKKPIPAGDDLSRHFWEAASEDRLEIQRCQNCRRYHQPPVGICPFCHSVDLRYEAVSGLGTIYTYTVTHDARTPAFAAVQPYAVVWVELDEQPRLRLISNMPGTPLDKVQIGSRVEVFFEEIEPGHKLPEFRLVD